MRLQQATKTAMTFVGVVKPDAGSRAASSSTRDGGTVVDPEVVRQLLRRLRDPLEQLTPRDPEVLAPVAEGRSNVAIAKELVVSEAAIGKHTGNIPTKPDLPPTDKTHRRVLAVLTYPRA